MGYTGRNIDILLSIKLCGRNNLDSVFGLLGARGIEFLVGTITFLVKKLRVNVESWSVHGLTFQETVLFIVPNVSFTTAVCGYNTPSIKAKR